MAEAVARGWLWCGLETEAEEHGPKEEKARLEEANGIQFGFYKPGYGVGPYRMRRMTAWRLLISSFDSSRNSTFRCSGTRFSH